MQRKGYFNEKQSYFNEKLSTIHTFFVPDFKTSFLTHRKTNKKGTK